MMTIRSVLVSEKIPSQKYSCTTKATNLQVWEIKQYVKRFNLQFLMSKHLFCDVFECIDPLLGFFPSDLYSPIFMSHHLFWESLILDGDYNSYVWALFSMAIL